VREQGRRPKSHNWHRSVSHTRVDPPYIEGMEPPLEAWNDERMDEFAGRTEENFKEVREDIREVRKELKGDIRDLRGEMNERFSGLERRFDIMFGAMVTGFVGLIVSHFLG
jgi:hypothetical protein